MMIAIVTGASSGIGEQILRLLVREQTSQVAVHYDQIWVIARNRDRLEGLRRELGPDLLTVFALDLSDPNSFDVISSALSGENPSVGLLVNCAGIGRIGRFIHQSPGDQRAMVALNCSAAAQLCSLCLPFMRISKRNPDAPDAPRIINIASSAGFLPQPGFATYAASKAFLIHFSRALSAELIHTDIRCTVVCPGPVSTDFLVHATGKPSASFSGIKRLFVARADKLAEKSIRAARKGKAMLVYGFSQKALHVAAKILPTRWMMFFATRLSGSD
ncbi:MAG: SDR family NAD(P)-dependent oxidoreductase [Clostridiaceae bacterium]|nr:SDR family NAD(P)-dependent oxidoreductase [Clostridiaceae bacterium]